jgi:hypothetical protein
MIQSCICCKCNETPLTGLARSSWLNDQFTVHRARLVCVESVTRHDSPPRGVLRSLRIEVQHRPERLERDIVVHLDVILASAS